MNKLTTKRMTKMNDQSFHGSYLLYFLTCASLMANATPSFQVPQALSGISGPVETWGVASADVNNDDCPDLFFGNHRGQPSLYIGRCDGTFIHKPDNIVNDNPKVDDHSTVFGDFNNDGCPDMHMSVGGTNPSKPQDKNQLLFNNCEGVFTLDGGSVTEYPEQRGRSSVPFDVDFDNDIDLATTGYVSGSQSTGGGEEIFENIGAGLSGQPWEFVKRSEYYEFDGHTITLFNIFANVIGNDELDLVCGEREFPRQECTKDVASRNAQFADNLISLKNPAKNDTADAFVEDIDNDGDNDIVALRRKGGSGNAKRYNNNTVVEGLNTSHTTSGIRCLGMPGSVDITSLVITGDYVNSEDIKFGSDRITNVIENSVTGSTQRYDFGELIHTNSDYIGLNLPDDSNGIDESERGTYIGYLESKNMWKVCDVTGTNHDFMKNLPKRKYNKYGLRIKFSGPVGDLVHENYDPEKEPLTPVVWINNGKDSNNKTIFEDKTRAAGITKPVTAFGLGKGDFDNDGDIDFVASYENHGFRGKNYLYTNDGNGVFQRSRFAGCPNGIAESVAVIDANADGLLDPVMGCAWYGLAHNTSYEHAIWLNNTNNSNKAIMFEIIGDGVSVNKGGIGARIKVTDANDKTSVICSREVGNTLGRGSQDSEFVHCGVASHDTVDVIIDWPGSVAWGQDVYDNVTTAAMYRLIQGASNPALIKPLRNSIIKLPVVTVNNKMVDESAGSAELLIKLPINTVNKTGGDITVQYTTRELSSVSAAAGADYSTTSGSATIEPNKNNAKIYIPITDDNAIESAESFQIVLSNPSSNATIDNSGGAVYITDND